MTDRQTLIRRIAVAALMEKRFSIAKEAAKAELSKQMTRGSEAVMDDCNREIGLVSIPKASGDTVTYDIDESVVMAWLIEESPEAIEPRISTWARQDVIERARKAYAAGEDLPAGVERRVTAGRPSTPRFIATKADDAMGIHSGDELVADMLRRGVLDLQEVLEVEA